MSSDAGGDKGKGDRHREDAGAHATDTQDDVRQPETLLAMCCRAVEATGWGSHGETALGGRERWHQVRIEALGPLARVWPCLTRPDAWDLAWYRPETVDLVGQVRAIDRTDPRLFPTRNTSTMGAWMYAHADGRLAPRLSDTHQACVEARLRTECETSAPFGRDGARYHPKAHVCSLSLPDTLVLDGFVAHLVARRGGPRPASGARGLAAGLRFVSQPRPLLACVPHLLAHTLRWPHGRRALPVAPAYPFDHVVVAEWERDGMRGLVCVNANPAAAHDYGHVSLVYLGAETFYAPCGMPLERLARLFVADRHWAPLAGHTAVGGHHARTNNNNEDGDFFTWAMRQCADRLPDRDQIGP